MQAATRTDRRAIAAEMDQARQTFHGLLDHATDTGLRRRSNGTGWTNEQLLFHMLFGYLITRALLILARIFGRLPDGASKAFAQLLDAARTPFHLINYLGSCAGARVIPYSHMRSRFDQVITALERRLDSERDSDLRRGMHFPTTWDPFFTDYMTLADLYRYPTQHFNYHRQQLTLTGTDCHDT
jgi:DinB superfamily